MLHQPGDPLRTVDLVAILDRHFQRDFREPDHHAGGVLSVALGAVHRAACRVDSSVSVCQCSVLRRLVAAVDRGHNVIDRRRLSGGGHEGEGCEEVFHVTP